MLTQSPVPAFSSAASPQSGFAVFHYAPAPPSQQTSSAAASSSSCRYSGRELLQSTCAPSSDLVASPACPRPRHYVAVDAATQYSPMELMDYRTGVPCILDSMAHNVGRESQPTPKPQPKALRGHVFSSHDNLLSRDPGVPTSAAASSGAKSTLKPVDAVLPVALFPRRQPLGHGEAGAASCSTPAPTVRDAPPLATHLRPGPAPPKTLSRRYEWCPTEDMVVLIAHMLGELMETNDGLALKSGHLTRFHSRTDPGISVLEYLHRLAKHASITPPLLLSMVYYIDRLCAMYPEFTINTLTVHRFLITAATVAAKGLSDAFWNNSTYARVGGIRVAELKLLELEFLYRVDWKIVPNPEILVAYYRGLVDRCPGYQLEPEPEPGEDDEEEDEEEESSGMSDEDKDVAAQGDLMSGNSRARHGMEGHDRKNEPRHAVEGMVVTED